MGNYAKLWLNYSLKKNNKDCKVLKKIVFSGSFADDKILENAKKELSLGLKDMLGIEPQIIISSDGNTQSCAAKRELTSGKAIADSEVYTISIKDGSIDISAVSSTGILYGVFNLLRTVGCEKDIEKEYASAKTFRPSNPLRMLNHWDNMDGIIFL